MELAIRMSLLFRVIFPHGFCAIFCKLKVFLKHIAIKM